MARELWASEGLALGESLKSGAEIMLSNGTRGVIYQDGHQWRIEWPSRVTFWSRWGLLERIREGSIVLIQA